MHDARTDGFVIHQLLCRRCQLFYVYLFRYYFLCNGERRLNNARHARIDALDSTVSVSVSRVVFLLAYTV